MTSVRPVEHGGSTVLVEIASEKKVIGRVRVSANVPLDDTLTPFMAAALPIALHRRTPLHLQGEVDGVALEHIGEVGALLSGWYPALTRVPVTAEAVVPGSQQRTDDPPRSTGGVGCFFSGGVDSLYSAVKHAGADLTHLIFLTGFDISLRDPVRASSALRANRVVADRLGLQLIEMTTDLRSVGDRYAEWGPVYHGAALAMAGLLLSPVLDRVLVPSTFQSEFMHPWGTHPDLDPLWSSSRVRFVHDGDERTRPQKVAVLADHPFALDHLRVCWEQRGEGTTTYNCGRCEKCVRTMVNLRVVGAAGKCATLPADLTPEQLADLPRVPGRQIPSRENLAELDRRGRHDPRLRSALLRRLRYDAVWGAQAAAEAQIRSVARRLLIS
ncbi:hypothetical protein JL107_17365 [Nakamurella flavida]|uniref:Uncharacterized protein n=1 Tax=Nakamurella flavida TaxID=363630 RepID=A0A938YIB9_9ACTN|nr:hypothetical protein [Nakamurella flavida]MBM9478221.1 hypothetical protein [Nakamurella flavida]MDP9778557.1 hypothetical protein [Nakamurella flavida]